MKRLDGYKTYIGAGLGLASVVIPFFGVPVAVSQGVAVVGAVIALYGRKHANSRFAKAFTEARELGQAVKGK